MRKNRSCNAVSEILATVLLLGIAVSLFSVLYVIVISSPVEIPSPSVILVGSIKEQNITINHHGGVALDLDTEILAIVGGARQNVTTARDYLDIPYVSNNKWDIGEKLVIDVEELVYPPIDVTDLQIEVTVVDVESNSILLTGVLREGEMISTISLNTFVDAINPYEIMFSPANITATGDYRLDNVTLWYRYSPDNLSWGSSASWWNDNWSCYRIITIDRDKIDEKLTNFPVLVKIGSAIGSKCDDGDSIRFIGTDNSTEYYYEIEKWDSSGDSYVWVNITSISSTADTTFLMYYNNSAASDNQNPSNVWDNFEAVYHLGEAYALDFDGSNDIVVGPSSNDITGDYLQTITFSAWVKHDDTVDNGYIASLKRQAGSPSTLIALDAGNTGAGNLGFLTRNYANTNHVWLNHNGGYNDGEWHHLVAVVNGLNRILYIDGIERNSDNEGIQNVSGNTAEFTIGGFHPTNMIGFDGSIDEVQIWNRSLSPSEINDLYHSKPVSRTRLVGEWLMDEGSGNDVSDSSSQGNDGDMSGHAASWIRPRAIDSTSNSNTGIREGSMAAAVDGKIDGADEFDGTDDYVNINDDGNMNFERTDNFSGSAWIKLKNIGTNKVIFSRRQSSDTRGYVFYVTANDELEVVLQNTNGNRIRTAGGTALSAGVWYYVVLSYDGSSSWSGVKLYVDGIEETEVNVQDTLSATIQSTGDFQIGDQTVLSLPMNGTIGEVRISNSVRSASWINASYQNQNDISSFLTIESEQTEATGSAWIEWNNDSNPDTISPWQWSFNFPNGTGYYEFYSIGKYNDDTEEAPENADTICYYNPSALLATSVDAINPYEIMFSPANITATGDYRLDNVTLWYRYSPDNLSWGSSASWWNDNWSCYRIITIDRDKIDEKLTNFPVLVKIGSAIGSKCDDGDSIRFIGTDNSTEYYYEIEKWDSSGDSYVWVNITSISSTADTTFLMYYNNSAASDNQNPSNVWDNFEAVYHLGEAYALDFDGSNDIVVGPSSNDITGDYLQTITFSAWVKHDDTVDNGYIASLKRQAGSPSTLIALDAGNTGAGNLGFLTRNYANTNHVWLNHNGGYNDGEWHHLVAVVNGLNRILYIDGIERNSDNEGIQNVSGNTAEFTIGGFHPTNMIGFDGSIDEVQIWNRSLSPSEINDLYHSKPVSRTRLVGEWLMDEGSGNDVSDSSSQGNDGDMSGHAASWIRPRAIDSTSNSNTGIREGSMAAAVDGKIDGADEFDGTDDYVNINDDGNMNFERTDNFSGSAWIKLKNIGTNKVIFSRRQSSDTRGYVFYVTANDELEVVLQNTNGNRIRTAGGTALSAGVWYYVVLSYDGSSSWSGVKLYVDGIEETEVNVQDTLSATIQSTGDFQIGDQTVLSLPMNGTIGEVRISNSVRSASWINASYQNQNDISSFLTIESEQTEATGSAWIEWNNDSNPDTISPWQWSFNFPNGTGYYEFYSIGKYNGDTEEAPESADAICHYNLLAGFVSHWHLDENSSTTAYDAVGNNNGTISGAIWTTGVSGSALMFDNVGDSLTVDSSSSLQITGNLSVSTWVYFNSLPSGSDDSIFTYTTSGESESHNTLYELFIDSNGDLIYKHEYSNGNDQEYTFTNADIAVGKWYHIVVTRNTTSKDVHVYINSSSISTYSYSANPTGGSSSTLYLGSDKPSKKRAIDGILDEVRVYNRLLSNTEIKTLYTSLKP